MEGAVKGRIKGGGDEDTAGIQYNFLDWLLAGNVHSNMCVEMVPDVGMI